MGGSLPYTYSADNLAFLRAMLTRSGLQLIGSLSTWEYQDLLGGDSGSWQFADHRD